MRAKLIMLVGLAISLVAFQIGFSQCTEDPNVRDTVAIGCQNVPLVPGSTFTLPIYIWNDEGLQGFSLGLKWDNKFIQYQSAALDPALQAAGFIQLVQSDTANNQLLLGVIKLGTGDIQAGATRKTVYNLTFKVHDNAQQSRITVDSAFYAPAGYFVLAKSLAAGSGDLCPAFVNCGDHTITLPVHEYDTPTLPTSFALSQNSPNPFNPTTSINFDLPKASNTRIEVYNVLGQRVKTLVNEFLSAGHKRVEWDGTDDRGVSVASGVYLYKMTAGDFAETKKMLLMK